MKLDLIRQLPSKNGKVELLFEVDKELLDHYKSETGDDDFDQDSFNEWVNDLIKYSLEGEDWITPHWEDE
jgi:hypothetical protein